VYYYSDGQWEKSVEFFEKSIFEFVEAEEQCRMDCEKPFDMGWFPDFVTAVASKFWIDLKLRIIKLAITMFY
jgi:hypothetical protein